MSANSNSPATKIPPSLKKNPTSLRRPIPDKGLQSQTSHLFSSLFISPPLPSPSPVATLPPPPPAVVSSRKSASASASPRGASTPLTPSTPPRESWPPRRSSRRASAWRSAKGAHRGAFRGGIFSGKKRWWQVWGAGEGTSGAFGVVTFLYVFARPGFRGSAQF